MCCKNEKPRRGFYVKNFRYNNTLLTGKHWIENTWIHDMWTRGFLTEILLHKYNLKQKKSNF